MMHHLGWASQKLAVFWTDGHMLTKVFDGALSSIVDAVLDGNMTKHNGQSLAQELQDAIVNASCKLLTSVQKVLRPTPMPGRFHYMFTLRDISKTFQVGCIN